MWTAFGSICTGPDGNWGTRFLGNWETISIDYERILTITEISCIKFYECYDEIISPLKYIGSICLFILVAMITVFFKWTYFVLCIFANTKFQMCIRFHWHVHLKSNVILYIFISVVLYLKYIHKLFLLNNYIFAFIIDHI